MARRKLNRKIVSRRRIKARRARKAAPPIRTQIYRSFKRIRPYNKGRLSLQARMQSGASLPLQTFARFYWRGSRTIDFLNSPTADNPQNTDLVFCLNNLHRPTYNYTTGNLAGTFSYEHVWRLLYTEALVLGSRLSLTIRKPMYPGTLASVRTLTNPSTAESRVLAVPANAMYGYWYMRVNYVRAADQVSTPGDFVGHDVVQNDALLWANMRDFQQDASVSWKRDKLPRVTKLGNMFPAASLNPTNYSPVTLYSGNVQPQQYYEVEYKNMPIRWSAKYSAKKHHMETNILRNGLWQSLDRPATPALLPPDRAFYVKFGYVAFDSTGLLCYTMPIDRINHRQIEAEIQYFCALREPRVSPWQPTLIPASLGLRAEAYEDDALLDLADDAFPDLPDGFDEELDDALASHPTPSEAGSHTPSLLHPDVGSQVLPQ